MCETRKQKDYAWYKSIGICVYCHKNKADDGHVDCLACRMDRREKGDTHSVESKEKHKLYLKNKREQNRANGICVVCGKRPSEDGKSYCKICKSKSKIRERNKRLESGTMPRFVMGNGEYCYFCGNPSYGKKVCTKCYERCKNQMIYARSFKNHENCFEFKCKNNV